jgi:transposase
MRGSSNIPESGHQAMADLGFEGAEPEVTGRPSYHPSTLLKIYIYGYLNRVQSSRRLEREAQRNVELIWLAGRLAPDFKTIADFRKDDGPAIRRVCREFVLLCRSLNLFSDALVAIDGSKFKAVNGRDRNFTKHKLKAGMQQLEESFARYLADLDRADRDPSSVTEARVEHLKEKVETVKAQMRRLKQLGKQMAKAPDEQISLTDPDARSMATSARGSGVVGYNVQTAVDTKHHLVVTHEVTNQGTDRAQLSSMGQQLRPLEQNAQFSTSQPVSRVQIRIATSTAISSSLVPRARRAGSWGAAAEWSHCDWLFCQRRTSC